MKTKKYIIISISFTAILFNPFSVKTEEQSQNAELKQEAVSIVKKFSGTLKPLLKGAIQSGGLSHAINICSNEAPRIAKQISLETGWTIKRVSLKPRNTKSAIADPFEQKVLEQFNERQQKGKTTKGDRFFPRLNKLFEIYLKSGKEHNHQLPHFSNKANNAFARC